ncbi:hypothetical protein AALP_AAs55289U000100 [Arabis alpina]|uniref:Dirigent protein n=1 Tax=Arabis alpina TaxID=50452 RepID=A0A087FWF0_ARAAL|nr:hypothetical protein AALP_AAs55289U000100 [Arabis alpina]
MKAIVLLTFLILSASCTSNITKKSNPEETNDYVIAHELVTGGTGSWVIARDVNVGVLEVILIKMSY